MENNQMKLTPDEINSILKIINCLSNYHETRDENYDKEDCALNKVFNDKEFQNSNVSWWEQTTSNNKAYYNQKAHIIMNLLCRTELKKEPKYDIKNKGYIYLLEYHICNNKSSTLYHKRLNLKTFFQNERENINNLENSKKANIDTLLECLGLYFSSPSNFSSSSDYSKYNVSILNNLYNWYLEDLNKDSDIAEITRYCKKILKIISNLQEKLIKYFDNTVYKYNLICTLCKTNEILNELKLKLLEDGDQTKDYLGTENDLINTILDHIELTPSIKFNKQHKK